ncbi:hypothetical protein Bequi_00165 [Brachybacterium sp. JHP9]|uniref:Uncharacterized protein n=1 Tax=Brachybacterium equifaecis TaxID=2910770 RepID=A0ABT0QWG7_9MICO|nr:hypothetical protein [Brachybacterium equifaecis]
MENFNLGAVLIALLLLLWIGYAVPRTAARRDVMGAAHQVERSRESATARDLSAAIRTLPRAHEVSPMTEDRMLLRPADPTRRPRFEEDPGTRVGSLSENVTARRMLMAVLLVLVVGTIALAGLSLAGMVPWWSAVVCAAVLGVYLVGLRRAELERRSRAMTLRAASRAEARRQHPASAQPAVSPSAGEALASGPHEGGSVRVSRVPADGAAAQANRASALGEEVEAAAEQVLAPGEWTPRPVPRPAYSLRGDVEDLATRHAAHRRSVAGLSVPLETESEDRDEALREDAAQSEPAPVVELNLNEVLARRRA